MPVISGPVTGIGVRPQVLSAAMDGELLRVTFSESMLANADLLTAGSYTIVADGGSAPRLAVSVQTDGTGPVVSVLLTLDGPTTNGSANYNVAVDLAVVDLAGNTLDPAAANVDFNGLTAAPAMDHVAIALSRLIAQYADKLNAQRWIRALVRPLQTIEQALQNTLAYRSLVTAFGEQQDRLGEALNITRTGLADADYRRVLQARALSRSARARGDDHLAILNLLDNGFAPANVRVIEHYPAGYIGTVMVPIGRNDLGFIYAEIFRRAKGNAIRALLMWQQDGATHFVWSGDTGAGFAEITDTVGTGGVWAEGV